MAKLDASTLRTMLIIGADKADAYAFVGSTPDAPPGSPVAEDRPSRAVPDDLWPPGEAFNGFFTDGWPKGRTYDAVIVTAAARAACGGDETVMRAWSAELVAPGGWLYLHPTKGA